MNTRTYNGYAASDNPLCQRLQREFRGRGVQGTAAGKRADTSVLLERVKRGLDPYENAADPTKRTVSDACVRRASAAVPRATAGARQTAAQPNVRAKTAASACPAPAAVKIRPAQSAPHRVQPQAKAEAAAPGMLENVRDGVREMVRRRRSLVAYRRQVLREEVRVRTPFPVAGVFLLCIFTVMALVLLLSFSQNYELQGEIARLQEDAHDLAQLQRDLEVQLEERDDIRVIEQIAVNEIGMVKNDLVESRFVSVSGGDRIELTPTVEEEAVQAGLWSTMLSAIGENFSRIREYIE